MSQSYRPRVGSVRPSHLMFTSGVGSLVDLPNFSVLVSGLDDWDHRQVVADDITEPRLLRAVSTLLRGVERLRPAPWLAEDNSDPGGFASTVGVPTAPFPSWLRCTACDELASIHGGSAFGFENNAVRRPQDARFFHRDCGVKKSGRKPLAVAARFVLSCTNGHLDEFPYTLFVHRGGPCPKATHPRLQMQDRGGNLGADVQIICQVCRARRNIREAQGERGEQLLPACRGRNPHLGTFTAGCDRRHKLLVVGASNQWFAQTLSALHIPPGAARGELDEKVDRNWVVLEKIPGKAMLGFTREVAPSLAEFVSYSDDVLWAAIERHRTAETEVDDDDGYPDLRTPEWEAFSAVELPEPSTDFTLRRDPAGVPQALRGCYSDVVQAERLREVRALIGFTRLDAPDPDDPDLVTRAALSRSDPTWVPASEVRGEGIFLRVPEEALVDWERRVAGSAAVAEHREAYGRFRENRYSDRIAGPFDRMQNWPGVRYLALHTLSHLLIRTIALECGYNSASLSERIYASSGGDDPRAGILIYTAVPDAEGTLGGLSALAEPDQLVRLTRRALAEAVHCSSDPLCAERLPHAPADFLHGAACHVCLFVSETTCERGNRFLDRRFVVPIDDPRLALFTELP
ncbi:MULTISPECIES: DUF1998 domain-containing protein [Actinoalloteichus]|uniref:DUF1998 family protein n=1 Tax=Actinoalloteichus fjordicus TaxID=1612552 RepID=A0AAC9LE18_9PSEU|nr:MULTISPECIES: DUF1998 domain-containing protein [Actinoalloteichus]APU16138.1 putative DUF1998 family protein [Actinoalloteichus fjordicus]APU22201.1 putative DUF1998 family protein [Actinoalloteichus sp. GBA129-24]